MQQPFPVLTNLELHSNNETAPVIPDSFLGGSAARLGHLCLDGVPFPGLPKLLLSATHLVKLHLLKIHIPHISPDAIVACLSVMPRLRKLQLSFQSPQSLPDRPDPKSQRLPPSTRFVLPALTDFEFKGAGQYLEDLVAHIDAPLLYELSITFLDQPIFYTPHLAQFISSALNLKAPDKVRITFDQNFILVDFRSQTSTSRREALKLDISCCPLSLLARVCAKSLPPLPTVEHLYLISDYYCQTVIGHVQWLELLRPFAAVKNLYLCEDLGQIIASALQDHLRQGATGVLFNLQNLFFELEESPPSEPVQEAIRQSLAARQLFSHPIAISHWSEREDW
jgi:hypothetical protein